MELLKGRPIDEVGRTKVEIATYDKLDELKIEYAVVNPTAGSHCGPDCVGISFYASHK